MTSAAPTICLCMIVKNEDHVIRRCLASVLPFIAHWVIVDTGSTDGTQETVRSFMQDHGMPGELFERPWIDFAHNRSESLRFAAGRADFLLLIDADEFLQADPGFTLPHLTADAYSLEMTSGPYAYPKTQLLRASVGWRYIGVVHEHLAADRPYTEDRLHGLRTVRIPDGARARDPLTYRRDALLLEEALLQDPDNARHMFYLAQSYADAKEWALAIDRYQKRVKLGGWNEEVWCSLYQIAKLREFCDEPWPVVQQAYLEAFAFRPGRAEPLFRIGAHYQAKREFPLAHLFFAKAMNIAYPTDDLLFVEREVYRFYLPLEYAVACFYLAEHETAIRVANRLLTEPSLTPEQRDQVIRNRQYSLDALYPPRQNAAEEDPGSAGVLVIVRCDDDAEHSISACVQSLRSQNRNVRAVFLHEGDRGAAALQSALDGTSFERKQTHPRASWGERLQMAAAEANPDDVLLLLDPKETLADKRSVTDLLRHFGRYGCLLMYAQFRWTDGTLGDAIPLATPADLETNDFFAHRPVLAFRKALLDCECDATNLTPLALLHRAGYDRIRFSDRPFTLRPHQVA